MRVRVLGCSGAIGKDCRTTAFLVDDDLLVDAGTGVGDLTLDEMQRVQYVLLSHSHLDHVVSLPLMVDAVSSKRTKPLQVHALQATIDALKAHIFNEVIWPDFSKIPDADAPFISFHAVSVGETIVLGGKKVEVLPAVHSVPAAGFAIQSLDDAYQEERRCWVFTGDTEANPALWARINELNVAMLVIETAFSNRESSLAKRSQHLSPDALAIELASISERRLYPIYITHTKPAETDTIMAQIDRFNQEIVFAAGHGAHDIRWLSAGQHFII